MEYIFIVSRCIPLYPAVSRCIPLYPAVSRCTPLYPSVSRCIPLYLSYPPISPRIWGPDTTKNILQSTGKLRIVQLHWPDYAWLVGYVDLLTPQPAQ